MEGADGQSQELDADLLWGSMTISEAKDIVADIGETAAKRCVQVCMDLASLCDDPKEYFAVIAFALTALVGAAAAAYAKSQDSPIPEAPTRELIMAMIDNIFPEDEST